MNCKPTRHPIIQTACFAAWMLIPLPIAQAENDHPNHQTRMSKHDMMKSDGMKSEIALDGYCPVCVIEMGKWEKGNPDIRSTHDDHTYTFPSKAIQAKFDAHPEKYIPVLHGDCIVCFEKFGKRVPGSVFHSVLHRGRLYLFPSEKEKDAFKAAPQAFANADLAGEGECLVCLKKMGKHVAGSPDHTVLHDGLRYWFPSAKEADVFRERPEDFLPSGAKEQVSVHQDTMHEDMVHEDMMKDHAMQGHAMKSMRDKSKAKGMSKKDGTSKAEAMSPKKAGMQTMIMTKEKPDEELVRVVGRSGCAGCEFGVSPIADPSELGLAVVDDKGQVTVIEGAHEAYPQIYSDRFEHQKLLVEGKIIKTNGKVSWLKPTSVRVIR